MRRLITGPDLLDRIESEDELDALEVFPGVHGTLLWVMEDSPVRPEQGVGDWGDVGTVPPGGLRWSDVVIEPGTRVRELHRTDTVDLVRVMEGELTLVMEDGSARTLLPGDCVVQRATVHTWENRSGHPCRMNLVMVSTRG